MKIGQRLHCVLHGGRDGVIADIQGAPSPETCRPLLGVGVTGGNAVVDVLWDNGTRSSTPESLIRCSVQWKLLPEVWTAEQIKAAEKHHLEEKARREAEAALKEANIQAQCAQLKKEYPSLLTAEAEPLDRVRAATNLRKLLKLTWPKVKFSVKKSDAAIQISWTDGPTAAQVEAIAHRFEAGHFNSMEDIYEYRDSAWTRLFGKSTYVNCSRKFSDVLVLKAVDTLWAILPGNLKAIPKPTDAEQLMAGYSPQVPLLSVSVDDLVRALCSHYDMLKQEYLAASSRYGRTTFIVDYAVEAQATALAAA